SKTSVQNRKISRQTQNGPRDLGGYPGRLTYSLVLPYPSALLRQSLHQSQFLQMQKTGANFEAVRVAGREFPDLCEGTMYGSPALKLGKRLVACVAIHRSAEPGSLVVRTDFEQRSALLDEDPGTYYITDHYTNHPVVLVRLGRLHHDQLHDLLAAARQCVLTDAKRLRKKSRRQQDQDPNPRR
ncbi:MAG: hypothetical protein ACJ746_16475, partial [Bryobacteraceae bacterium]